jgi:hypothetical protein
MPVIYNYLGIKISFFSNEHEPIHIHADYNGASIKVSLFIEKGVVGRTTYKAITGKFNKAKLADLKHFVSVNKNALLFAWKQKFENDVKIKPIIITKKIK